MRKTFFVSSMIITLGFGGWDIVKYYHLDRDIESVASRAQVSGDMGDMLFYMRELKGGMEKWGLIKGHSALIFKNPRNDVGLLYVAIQQIILRLDSLQKIPKNAISYQVALDDLRGTIRELQAPSMGWWFAHWGWWHCLILLGLWLLILWVFRDNLY